MLPRPLILFVASEMYPFSKTGGLGDVMGALPLALHRMGYNTAVITPFYGRLSTGGVPVHLLFQDSPVGYPWAPVTCDVYMADYHGMPVYFIDRAECFDRRFYYNTHKGDYFDNAERFIFFCRAALGWAQQLESPPAVIHAHDWQSALIPAYVEALRRSDPLWADTRTVQTIHNLAFQGRFASRLFFQDSDLPVDMWHPDGVEFYGDFNFLKSGIAYAHAVTTVSPGYAAEITTPVFGCGLEGILGKRSPDLTGILNGTDYEVWDPGGDRYLPAAYGVGDMAGKCVCKAELVREFGLDRRLLDRPLLGFIGRMRRQKGIDLLLDIVPELMARDLGVIILGEGNLDFEARAMEMMEEYPDGLAVRVGYTEDLAHRIQAGADIFLMPSRYEPCGLTQMYSLRYGTPPVATAVGGLKDTIVSYPHPEATGFTFEPGRPGAFLQAVLQAVALWSRPQAWWRLRKRAMEQDFSWSRSAQGYLDVYRRIGAVL